MSMETMIPRPAPAGPRRPASPPRGRRLRPALLALLVALPLASCANTDDDAQVCQTGSYSCSGGVALRCRSDGAGWEADQNCAEKDMVCTELGCRTCAPDSITCNGADVARCNADGTAFLAQPVESCNSEAGMVCDDGRCINACERAAAERSYVGCEYWAVDLDNAVTASGEAAAQQFAVALSNPSILPASVTVSVNTAPPGVAPQLKTVATRKVPPQALEVILLDSREVDGSPEGQFNAGGGSALSSSAFKIASTAPIVVYQFNPLSNVGVFSNDASLLIPVTALSTSSSAASGADYMVMGWPQTIAAVDGDDSSNLDLRAFLTVVGTQDDTTVKVTLSTDVVADTAGALSATKKGETLEVKLNAYDVLNLETGGFNSDFTGTVVSPDRPVVVFSGSEASDVPDFTDLAFRKCCADHLEQQLFPRATLGTSYIALTTPSRTRALREAGASIAVKQENDYFRILAAGEFTAVTTNLPPPHDSLTIGSATFAQVKASRDFTIKATDAVVVGQFVSGQEDVGIPTGLPGGDPSFVLLPPVEQFRKDYLFLTPDKYAFDFIMVAAPAEAKVELDGRPLREGCDSAQGAKLCCTKSEVGAVRLPAADSDTLFVAYKCQLSFPLVLEDKVPPDNVIPGQQNDGVHRLSADMRVGLVVYGFDNYVSYGYPGGTDLQLINIK